MSHNIRNEKAQSVPPFLKGVRYCWSLRDGTICHGSTVVMRRTKAGLRQALKRFWHSNTHVYPEAA